MWKVYFNNNLAESNLFESKFKKICSLLFLIVLFSINLKAQSPQGIGKFKIINYTLDSLFSEYEFSDLKDSMRNFSLVYDVYRFGGNKNYEILADDGINFPYLSIEGHRAFIIFCYSVAGMELKGLNLYFYEGVLYKICILNNIDLLLDKLIIKYPSIEKDETKNEKKLFQNAFGAVIEKNNFLREGNWIPVNGIVSKFFDNYYYDDQGDLQHIEQIMIYNESIVNTLKEIKKDIESEKQKKEENKIKEEIMKSDL